MKPSNRKSDTKIVQITLFGDQSVAAATARALRKLIKLEGDTRGTISIRTRRAP